MTQDDYQPTRHSDSLPGEPPEWAEYRRGFPCLGQKLLDRYEIFGVREGGFSHVFFVTDVQTHRDYAVKTPTPEGADRFSSSEQFKTEVAFWLNLEPHPNIVSAYFVEMIQDQPYLFMEYVTGGSATSLRDWLRYGRFGVSRAIELAHQLCLGMEFANRKGEMVHGDLKPENLLIDRRNVLKITDFGLAQRIQVRDGTYAKGQSGTWAYAPPERFSHQAVDRRWDIFAFGIVFYEMLTGKLPYPFELSRDPTIQFKQLADFHERNGMHKLAQALYYHGIPDFHGEKPRGKDLGVLLSGCLGDLERIHDFKTVREMMEQGFPRDCSIASNQLSPGDPPDMPVSSIVLPLHHLRQRACSLQKIGHHSQALTIFNHLLQRYPEEGRLWLDAAHSLLAVGLKRDAYEFLERAVQLNPQLVEDELLQRMVQREPLE